MGFRLTFFHLDRVFFIFFNLGEPSHKRLMNRRYKRKSLAEQDQSASHWDRVCNNMKKVYERHVFDNMLFMQLNSDLAQQNYLKKIA